MLLCSDVDDGDGVYSTLYPEESLYSFFLTPRGFWREDTRANRRRCRSLLSSCNCAYNKQLLEKDDVGRAVYIFLSIYGLGEGDQPTTVRQLQQRQQHSNQPTKASKGSKQLLLAWFFLSLSFVSFLSFSLESIMPLQRVLFLSFAASSSWLLFPSFPLSLSLPHSILSFFLSYILASASLGPPREPQPHDRRRFPPPSLHIHSSPTQTHAL